VEIDKKDEPDKMTQWFSKLPTMSYLQFFSLAFHPQFLMANVPFSTLKPSICVINIHRWDSSIIPKKTGMKSPLIKNTSMITGNDHEPVLVLLFL
jgi:restriction endonuclease S subunit